MTTSAKAELSSISAQLEELMHRVTAIGDLYRTTPDSQFVTECNNTERLLMSSIRTLNRAKKHVN